MTHVTCHMTRPIVSMRPHSYEAYEFSSPRQRHHLYRIARCHLYGNPDEPVEMTPSPSKLEPASPDDRKMEDALWTPSKQGASSNVAGLRQKVAAADNLTPAEYESAIFSSVPFGVAMAQDFARSQHVSPIGIPATAQDSLSPGIITMRTLISTEITTSIKTTPSPLQSPTPAPKPTDTRRRTAAKPQKTADAPRRKVASSPQRKGKSGTEQNKNQRRSAKPIIPGGINRRQELRTEPRYSLRDSTRDIGTKGSGWWWRWGRKW